MSLRWTRARIALVLCAVVAVGVALRAGPLWQSPLPFNPDGLYHARNAERTVSAGRFPLEIMATDDLGFAAFLAVAQSVTGIDSLTLGQPVIAVVGTVPALVVAAIGTRVSHRLGATATRAQVTGVLAALLLAVEGLYLYRSMPVDEQTPGLSLVALAVAGAVYWHWRGDRRWLLAIVPILLFVPALHNLESIVLGLALLAVAGVAASSGGARRTLASAVILALGFWAYFVGLTVGIAEFTPAHVTQSGRLTDATGLFLAWIVLALCGIGVFARLRDRSRRLLLLGPFLAMFVIVAVNAVVPVFPGTPTTTRAILLPALGLLVPVGLAIWGYPLVTRDSESNGVLVALVAGPLTLVGFALSASLTPEYLNTAVRAHWFAHLPILVLAALTVSLFLRDRFRGHRLCRGVVVGCLVLAVAVSIPVAFAGLSVQPYKGVTTTGELSASTFAHDRVPGTWTSDNHLVRITGYNAPRTAGAEAPLYDWFHNPDAEPPACPVLLRQSWTTVGAQFFPRPPSTVDTDRLESLQRGSHRVYHGGSARSLALVVPRGSTGTPCPSPS